MQTGSRTHLASYSKGTVFPSVGGGEADHLSLSSNADVNAGSNTSTPFMCLHGLHYDNCAANYYAAVHPVMVCRINTDIRTAVSHKNVLYFRQYMLHVSVLYTVLRCGNMRI